MSAIGFNKQSSSRPVKYQVLNYNSATVFSTNFATATQQIRLVCQVGGWVTINQTTSDTVIATTAGGVGMIVSGPTTAVSGATISAGTPTPEYFIVTPGQILCFASTSTSTGSVSVTEMS